MVDTLGDPTSFGTQNTAHEIRGLNGKLHEKETVVGRHPGCRLAIAFPACHEGHQSAAAINLFFFSAKKGKETISYESHENP